MPNNKLIITIEEIVTDDIIGYEVSGEITPRAEGELPPIHLCILNILLTKATREALKIVIGEDEMLTEGDGALTPERIAEAAESRDAIYAQNTTVRSH